MDKKNIILSLPRSILRQAKKIAADQNRFLSDLIVELLTGLVAREDQYASAKRNYQALLDQDTDLGTKGSISWTRADLHTR